MVSAMPEPASLSHPRKLYVALRACPTAEARARAVLAFLSECTGAEGGFLFLSRASGLALAARAGAAEPAADLVAHAARAFEQQLHMPPDEKKTREIGEIRALLVAEETPLWKSGGESFERRVLSTHRGERWTPIGIAVLKVAEGKSLRPVRHVHVEAICRALLDAGDVVEPAAEPELRSE